MQKAINRGGFARIDLVALCLVSLLLVLGVPSTGRLREKAWITVDLNNMRQILWASGVYSAENNDHMAHPTWGSDLTGPDGWAYRTTDKLGPVPGALSPTAGSCGKRDVNSKEFTNQLAYFKVGQVTQHLPDVRTAWCPKDVATRGGGGGAAGGTRSLREIWLTRPMKVTSYAWNGTLGGYVGPRPKGSGWTYKTSDFLPGDWQMWEIGELDGFHFNDAGTNPDTPVEYLSFRHAGFTQQYSTARDIPTVMLVGTVDGSSMIVPWALAHDLARGRPNYPNYPNAFLNGPGYRR